jgi:hypothetical protein
MKLTFKLLLVAGALSTASTWISKCPRYQCYP